MELVQLFQELLAKLADARAALEAEKQASYDAGFAAGVQSVSGNDKVYSQAEFDAKLAEALAPVLAQIESLKVEVAKASELVAKYDAAIQAEIEDAKTDSSRLELFKQSLGV
jgi:hypothetical protein